MNATVPEIDLADPAVVADPFTAHGRARERSPVARLRIPGMAPMWVMTRHHSARELLTHPRFELRSDSYLRPDVPEDCRPYLRTMSEQDGPGHQRLRRLVAPAFTVRRAADFRPRIERLVAELVEELPARAEDGVVDLVEHLARPLPMDVICELVGVPEADRPAWRRYGAAVAAGRGEAFTAALTEIVAHAKAAVAERRAAPGDDLISDLVRVQAEDGDRLGDTELVALVWHLVLAGQTPANLIANAIGALLTHPDQLALFRGDPGLAVNAVQELMRWCAPQILTVPRYAREDVEIAGVRIKRGEAATASLVAANRDPRVFDSPERLDLTRRDARAHLGFGHGPHFCLGAAPARLQVEAALTALWRCFPDLALAVPPTDVRRAPDGGTWRLAALPVRLGERRGRPGIAPASRGPADA